MSPFLLPTDEPIAIIGSACRFPGGSSSTSKLWELLREPRDVVRPFDPKRFNLGRFYHPNGETHGATDVKAKSYLLEEDNRLFDAGFFSISPVEAAGMDPQQRLLLEATYEASESAGVTLEQLRGSLTSVYVGVMSNDYSVMQARDTETLPKYNATGTANSILSNRVSYVFDLKGASVTLDTACSSSLVALHHAVQELRNGDCEMAVVGGTNLLLEPTPYIGESKLHMLSPDSQSRMWDKSANGYARGEGIASLLLKPLSAAKRDGDPIQGVIRASGVNSDGTSPGITMPFAPTQSALIRHVYRRAGLDPMRDPPQYFECHGTGTQAGDPVEARAVFEAFYRDGETGEAKPDAQTIHVGSIKTIIGHLEGCAGLAGVIKVLLALKHKTIPPNMHFKELNPKLTPYYGDGALMIPTQPVPWPELPAGTPMRASINSFGFGGTNAHVIIESLPPSTSEQNGDTDAEVRAQAPPSGGVVGPLLFSASSGPALLRNVQAYLAHVQKHEDIDLRDLSWILQTRRSAHRVRTCFTGASRQDVLDSMAKFVATYEKSATKGGDIGTVARLVNPKEVPGTLGVFTGQGAQWATMGRDLLSTSPLFRKSLEACEAVLRDNLLPGDAPKWSLIEELTKEAGESRLSEAALAQPLSTALQIGLVDMLNAAGVQLDAAVGHSSGEIAAAYAAGIITSKAAMQISYYRGFYAHLCQGANGEKGGMIAVGLSMDAASRFCRQPIFEGRLVVAASNSPQSCTLSGDLDAVVKAKQQLDQENTFARQLQVDTAYHSHHMQACASQYLQALVACDIQVSRPKRGCVWNSSVRGDTRLLREGGELDLLKGPYWVANMVQTVKFSQAIESSIWHGGPWDMAIEIGPHPALKGPAEQTLKAAYGSAPRYIGLLKRKTSDVAAFQDAIGQIWAQLGPSSVDFAGYRSSFYDAGSAPALPQMISDLPGYSWDHDKVYWRESRTSMRYRTGRDVGHELLGRRVPDDNERELRWRNVLRLGEMPWLRGHEVLGEVLLPGAAYVSIAAQAAQSLATIAAPGRLINQLSVEDVDILRPVVVPDNKDGVETLFTAQVLSTDSKAPTLVHARFSYYVCQNEATGAMIHTCSGVLVIHLGQGSADASDAGKAFVLPPRQPIPENVVPIEREPVYDMFRGIGLNYTGAFDAITESRRCLGYTAATGVWPADSPIVGASAQSQYVLHPAILDVAFQSLFVAHVHPSSKKLTSALLPSHIDRVIVDPHVPVLPESDAAAAATTCSFDAWVVSATGTALDGDINIYEAESGRAFVQVEGLSTRSAGGAQDAAHDKHLFLKTVHGHDASMGGLILPARDPVRDTRAVQANLAIERLALFYMRRVLDEIKSEERSTLQPEHQTLLQSFERQVDAVRQDQSPLLSSDCLQDDVKTRLADLAHPDPEAAELKLVHAMGAELVQVVRGQAEGSWNLKQYLPSASAVTDHAISQMLKQVTFKFPRCKMLEIGNGTGKVGTARSILGAVENMYDSYTYTSTLSDVFPSVATELADFERVIYQSLDIEGDVESQGFSPNSYDVVIAPHVLSANTATGSMSMREILQKARELLRPGGYLVLSEMTGSQNVVGEFLFGGKPTVSMGEWHRLLRRSGFSGADIVFCDNADESKHVHSCIVSRAVNDDFLRLVEPMSSVPESTTPLLIIGGRRLYSSKVIDEIEKLLPRSWEQADLVNIVSSIDALTLDQLEGTMNVVCLQDADESLFAQLPITDARLEKLQQMLMSAKNLLWVTGAGTSYSPRASMIRGIARVVPVEMPHLTMQVLGLELEAGSASPATNARHCVEALFRLLHQEDIKAKAAQADSEAMLFTVEPESEVLTGGTIRIPRVMPDTDLDERFNAKTRSVVKTVDATNVAVQAVAPQDSSRMVLQAIQQKSSQNEGIQVQLSMHIPSYSQNGQGLYVLCGQQLQKKDGKQTPSVMAVSRTNASKLYLEAEELAMIHSSLCTPGALEVTANALLQHALINHAQSIAASRAGASVTVLLIEPEQRMAERIKAQLAQAGHRLYCVSSKADAPSSWIRIHANASKRMAKQCLPAGNVDLFVNCSTEYERRVHGYKQLQACLPSACETWRLDAELLQKALESNGASLSTLLGAASIDLKDAQKQQCKLMAAANLAGADATTLARQRYITDWSQRQALSLTVQPLDVNPLDILRPDRTYLLVGGSGGLGLSLCHLMIRHGARHIAVTSRNPKIDAGLQREADRFGASVQMVAMDATKRDQVVAAVNKVRETMPPIAGVCNLSMVLHDKMFLDMSARQLNGTLDAKVIGTEILDDIFSNTDANAAHPPLDFFVLTSSTASTVGNVGQANYHAANLFMAAVVERRRSRGLAGSVIHIGWVADTGYVTRSDRYQLLEDHFRSMRFIPLSETDVHDAFAQAVRAGMPRPGLEAHEAGSHDITMGLDPPTAPMQPNQKNKALWVMNPQLMSLCPYSTLSESSQQQLPGQGLSGSNVREQVDAAESEEAAVAVVATAFASKLETMLQLPTGSVLEDLERPVINLGIDSLVATEIRTWFLKDVDAEVAVVKILGGDTVLQICAQATKKIWANRSPKEKKGVAKEAKRPVQSAPAPVPAPVVAQAPAAAPASIPVVAPPVAPVSAPTSIPIPANIAPDTSIPLVVTPARSTSSLSDASYFSTKSSSLGDEPGSGIQTAAFTPMTGSAFVSGANSDESEKSGCEDSEEEQETAPPTIIRETPMSAAQSRIWFVSKHYDDAAAYNTAFHYRIQGHISIARLRRALQLVVNHHECLRTCFYPRLEDGHPMQGVMATSEFELTVKHADDDDSNAEKYDDVLRDTLSQFKSRVWNLEQGRTMAIAVLGRSSTEHDLVLGYHHILMDGWSLALFLRDVDRAYRLQPLDTLTQASYVDYSIHQLAEEKTGVLDEHLSFWHKEFETLPDTLPLLPMARGLDRSTLTQQHNDNGSHYLDRELSPAQMVAQKDLCKRLRVSPFHLHLAMFQVVLARLANIDDVCVGVVDANRRDERFGGTVGCFVNMLPLRCTVPGAATFADVAVGASRKAMEIFSHGTVPFDRILDQTQAPRAVGTNPLFQAAINYRTAVGGMDMWNLPLGEDCRMQLSTEEAKEAENPYDISLGFIETQSGCLVQMWCLADLYGQDACRTMLDSYLGLLEVLARDPYISVADVKLHDAATVNHALQMGKGAEMNFAWPSTLVHRVQDMCLLHPTTRSITESSGKSLTYSQLATKVNRVAQSILDAGAIHGDRIAVLCSPSIDSIAAMLAILHIGCVYVPLDTSLPASRHTDIVSGCDPKILLCHAQTEQHVQDLLKPFCDVRVIQMGSDDEQGEFPVPPITAKPDSPAVLLFTSGSTGTPKGIVLTQANFVNHVALKTHQMGLKQECVLQQSSLGFDMSLIQIFSALANGGHLVIAGSDIRRDPVEIAKLVSRNGVSMTIATPTEYLAWTNSAADVLQKNKDWRFAFSGGEQVPAQLKTELHRLGLLELTLTNCYGPTEITAAATFQSIWLESEANSSCLLSGDSGAWTQYAVGKALPNYSICIVDGAGHPLPTRHIGEICIGGAGVATGYLNQPDQTKAKFVADVTAESGGSIMYRTGDKGRLLSDGTLLCLGRLDGDTQIKLRGQRIELQEVESALLQASEGALESVVVSLRGHVLVAHATLSGPSPDACVDDESRATLQILSRVKLPQAFVPATIRILATMPTTSNGKLDRKAIANLPLSSAEQANRGTANKTIEKMTVREGELRLLWERVLPTLGDTRLGPSSDFFLCGGNSLLLMKLQKAIKETTGVHITTKQLYEATTLRAMTSCVFDRGTGTNSTEQEAAPVDWEVETAVPAWLQERVQTLTTEKSLKTVTATTEAVEVLLTGATSFLGGHLLRSLLQSPTVAKVHCVAVPIDEQDKLPKGNSKAVSYSGSLLSPTLGLTLQERTKLEQTVHVVVHAGANGHCLNRFDSLRTPNLQSLHFLASLALPRSVPLLFLSSSRAVLLSGNPAPKPGSLKATPPPVNGKDGYTASKWAGEVFLENLIAHLNKKTGSQSSLKVAVHRPCTLVSEQAPNSDAMNGILRYSLSMRCAPRLKRAEGYLDFGPLDTIIDQITKAALDLAEPSRSQNARRAEIQFRHHSGGVKSPMGEFRAHLERVYGGSFDELDMEEWVVRAGQQGMDPLIVAYIEALLESGMPMISPYMGEE